jgi:outer membrane protein assembly factor BamB
MAFEQDSGELAWAVVLKIDAFSAQARGDLLLLASTEQVVALRGDTGDQVWSSDSTSLLSAATSDRVHTVWGAQVRALALADGAELWSTELPDATSSVQLSGDRLLAQVGDEIVALSADDGEQLWTTPIDTGEDSSIDVVGDATVVVSGEDEAVALDSVSGKRLSDDQFHLDDEVWIDSFGFRLTTGPVVLLSFEQEGWAQVADGTTGDPIGRVEGNWPTLSATTLYSRVDGELTAYRIADMEERWSLDIDGSGVVVPGDDLIVVITETGVELWT